MGLPLDRVTLGRTLYLTASPPHLEPGGNDSTSPTYYTMTFPEATACGGLTWARHMEWAPQMAALPASPHFLSTARPC